MINAVRGNITNFRVIRRLSTSHQIARRCGNLGYSLVNKSLANAGSAHRHRPINPANLLARGRKTAQTNVGHRPPATNSP
jgi:hypothetical protein